MNRFLLLAALLATTPAGAATISSTTCPGTGCSVSLVADTTALAIQVTGTWVGSIIVELSNDNVTFVTARAYPVTGGFYVSEFTGNGAWVMPTGGLAYFRVRATGWTSGLATVSTRPTPSGVPDFGAQGVTVAPPEGGLPVTLGAQRVAVEATGPAGGPVTTYTELTQPTLDFLNPTPRPCIIQPAKRIALPATPTTIPRLLPDGGYPALSGRTLIHAINSDDKDRIVCDVAREDGGLPDCTTPTPMVDGNGLPLDPNGGSHEYELADSVRLYCLACVGGGTAEFTYAEDSCAQ